MKAKWLLALLLFFLLPLQPLLAGDLIEGVAHDEALQLGEQMYRTGILPSGKPMRAMVMGDIPVDGRMFTCDDCHQRSGLGSEEGTVITWPTTGKELFTPRRRTGAFRPVASAAEKVDGRRTLPQYYQVEDVRPAYTDKTLARALRTGVDPASRRLDPIMPKFHLSKSNMALLVYYLKHLSVTLAPGVDETTLQFATVITDDVPDGKTSAMLSVLQAHIDAHNSQSRHEERRATAGPFYKSERHRAYRRVQLHIWELQGPGETWRDQLESYYEQQPVFALLGGITGGSWEEIHRFTEEHQIPSLFPITDLPAISEADWYTLYFSKGSYQEGESTAKFIRAQLGKIDTLRITQVYRQNNRQSAAIARGFEQTWRKMGGAAVEDLALQQHSAVTERLWSELFKAHNPEVVLLWLDNTERNAFNTLSRQQALRPAMLFTSAPLLRHDFSILPDELHHNLLITYPYSLPHKEERSRFAVKRWLKARNIPLTHFDIQAKMYFLGWMLPGALKNLRSEFFREYFLEGFDMMIDQDYAIAVYPRLTFGPGQRYASKGCYIVKLTQGPNPEVVPVSDWVTY